MKFLKCVACFCIGLFVVPGANAQHDPRQPLQGTKSDPVTYDIDFSAVVTAPYHTKTLKVWLALPQSDVAQTIEGSQLSTFPMKVLPQIGEEKVHGNRFAYFEFKNPEGGQIIRHKFKATIHEMRWNIDPNKVTRVERWPASFEPYLKSDRSVILDDRVKKIAFGVVPNPKNPSQDLASIMNWVSKTMKYDHANASLKASADHALSMKSGHCSDYHGLCAAFGRALGYPTRVTYGINPFPKNSPSHCKLEAFLPPYGWVSFDVSETQRLMQAIRKDAKLTAEEKSRLAAAATNRLTAGFRDNTWFCLTRGTDYDLAPPAAKRVPVVRTAYIEADGIALPDPDPADPEKREHSWMTIHKYTPDREVPYPFKDFRTLSP